MIASFSDANYVCLDRSPYEGADIIHDMNSPLPVELVGKYDFIYNGSCMGNIFDPVSFIRNTSKMLKVGGRLLMTEASGPNPGAYLTFSPQWFFSFFAVNNFVDCKVYLVVGRDPGPNRYMYDCDLFLWKPDFTRIEGYDYHAACRTLDGLSHVLILAEKGPDSTDDQSPVQLQYIDDQAADWTKKHEAFSKSDRPILNAPVKRENVILPYNSDHHIYLGSRF
jgi:SAM-dependent methyltransferase